MVAAAVMNNSLSGDLSVDRTRLHNLLWVEEAQHVVNMRRFDLIETTLTPITSFDEKQLLIIVDQDRDPACELKIPGRCDLTSILI
jgi:hypothetical protein